MESIRWQYLKDIQELYPLLEIPSDLVEQWNKERQKKDMEQEESKIFQNAKLMINHETKKAGIKISFDLGNQEREPSKLLQQFKQKLDEIEPRDRIRLLYILDLLHQVYQTFSSEKTLKALATHAYSVIVNNSSKPSQQAQEVGIKLLETMIKSREVLIETFGSFAEGLLKEDCLWKDFEPEISQHIESAYQMMKSEVTFMVKEEEVRIGFDPSVRYSETGKNVRNLKEFRRKLLDDCRTEVTTLHVPETNFQVFRDVLKNLHIYEDSCQSRPPPLSDCLILFLSQLLNNPSKNLPLSSSTVPIVIDQFYYENVGTFFQPCLISLKKLEEDEEFCYLLILPDENKRLSPYIIMELALGTLNRWNSTPQLNERKISCATLFGRFSQIQAKEFVLAYSEFFTFTNAVRDQIGSILDETHLLFP